MDQARRIGQHILIERVALDPFGSLHRAVKLRDGAYDRHALVRLYNGEVLRGRGFDARLHKAGWVIHDLPREWACGRKWRIDDADEPILSCDFTPGLTLASLVRKAARARQPLPPRFVLAVLQRVAVGLRFMRSKDVGFGVLSPHAVWVGFDGVAHLLDAPMAPFLAEGISRMPEARMALLPFLGLGADEPERRDCFQLGALAYTALTASVPPGYRALCHGAAPELAPRRSPFPEGLRRLMARLVGSEDAFPSLAEGCAAIDALAFGLDPDFECGAVARAVHLRANHPDLHRQQARDLKREARADWGAFLAMERIQRQHDEAFREAALGRGLMAGVTG
ncbi:MAG: hypothetical protein U0P81_12175 [Holophagaceae bacterium]